MLFAGGLVWFFTSALERSPADDVLRLAELDQRREIARVARARMCRELPLVAQAREKAVDAARSTM